MSSVLKLLLDNLTKLRLRDMYDLETLMDQLNATLVIMPTSNAWTGEKR